MIVLYVLAGVIGLILAYILFLFICTLFISPDKEYEKHSGFYRFLLNLNTAIALWIMRIRIQTIGVEKLPADTKNILFVSNHRSNFDPIVTWYALKKWKPAFVSKPENFDTPVFGRFIRKCCFMAIDRENPRNAMKTIFRAAELLQKGEVSVGVYPEGTRSKDCQLLPFHNGVFKIAQRAGASIAVVSVTGTENVHKNFPWHRSKIELQVLEVIPPEQVTKTKTDVLGERIKDMLYQKLER